MNLVIDHGYGKRVVPFRDRQPEDPYDPNVVNSCTACAFYYAQGAAGVCDLTGKAVALGQPMCAQGDARPSPTWYGNSFDAHNGVEDDTDAFRRADS